MNNDDRDRLMKPLVVCEITQGAHDWRLVQWEQSVSRWAESMRSGPFPVGEITKLKASCSCGARVDFQKEGPL